MTRLTFTCLLTYVLFFSVGNLHAQSVVYVYDAAGNRVSRAYVSEIHLEESIGLIILAE
ncbi:MAG: hypothetical protein PHQ26_08335 [Bacteroidales bacterium]|jgi:hypothetical protein|nr:hypothetical protein [Bacteroidales bacterium]MDD4771470.1 hypothetical protein [Bacteroidales bacterium]